MTQLTRDLTDLTLWTVKEVNRYLSEFNIYGKTLQDYKDSMNTADFTKFFQYIVNDIIEAGIKELDIDGRREEVSGYDYVFGDNKV